MQTVDDERSIVVDASTLLSWHDSDDRHACHDGRDVAQRRMKQVAKSRRWRKRLPDLVEIAVRYGPTPSTWTVSYSQTRLASSSMLLPQWSFYASCQAWYCLPVAPLFVSPLCSTRAAARKTNFPYHSVTHDAEDASFATRDDAVVAVRYGGRAVKEADSLQPAKAVCPKRR